MDLLTTLLVGYIIAFRLVISDREIPTVKSNGDEYPGSSDALLSESDSKDERQKRAIVVVDGDSSTVTGTHNILRRLEESSDMETLTWNEELAKMAQEWANGCAYAHGQPYRDPSSRPYPTIGQNLYITTGTLNTTRAIAYWYDEKKFYDYNTLNCATGKVCGHYTQVVWSNTIQVGCGFSFCPKLTSTNYENAIYFVCNYGPAGNYVGQKPYTKGTPCSYCDNGKAWCNKGLCNRNCVTSSPECECSGTCQNCGTMKYDSCSCFCPAGWLGSLCPAVCKDMHPWCNKSPGWPRYLCSHETLGYLIRKMCPAMCGLCEVANGSEPLACSSTAVPIQPAH